MNIIHLPQDVFPGEDRIVFHEYAASPGAFKGKGILQKNAISLVISGEKTMRFAETTVHARDTEFHFLSAGNCVVTMNLAAKTAFRSVLVFFDTSVWTDFFIKYAGRVPALPGAREAREARADREAREARAAYLSFPKDPFIRNYIDSVRLLLPAKGQFPVEMRQLKLEELWLYLLEKYPTRLLSFQPDAPQYGDDLNIRKIVETNVISNISIADMAFLCHMSMSTFKRRFVRLYGKSPNEWFLQERMKLAKELLLHHRAMPSEVFDRVGYESHSSFSQAFRKTFGKTPSEFQSEYLNDGPQ
ncbi:helix-turn-helix transcriptional regulator [Puia dinghuensis]|uniref:AraC family transcriptional regulator n=1 Tax=Puia dinghuensis TaxID=1792502 RepID=A0A8J2XSK4_9BACT|nr:helix-turn-helix transcriptional regulator [Puia dinghuensis]GGA96012.1 AraC family transcriptional regulator [Puia dinghuensis]